jgi:hypothetical protein
VTHARNYTSIAGILPERISRSKLLTPSGLPIAIGGIVPDEEKSIPVFMPPLAAILGAAESKKGSALSQAEVMAIRDTAPCMMMQPSHAQALAQSRGYVDVNPENYWADWHRLRVQMTGKGYLPKIVLCVPGGGDLRERCEPILSAAKIEYEYRGHDPTLVQAFRYSSVITRCFTQEDFERIGAHTTILFVLSKNVVAAEAPEVARSFVKLGWQLLEAGGIAIKCESAGVSHSPARWKSFYENAESGDQLWWALFNAYVVLPIGTEEEVYSCGMHLLGAPDLIISMAVIQNSVMEGESALTAAERLLRIFAIYLLSECPVGTFASGHTFSIDAQSPRYRLLWEPCTGYEEDDLFFNPFGRWRFVSAE